MDSSDKQLEFLQTNDTTSGTETGAGELRGNISNSSTADAKQSGRGGDNAITEIFKASSHPRIAMLHVTFKVLALFSFFFGLIFGLGYISWFVPCVIILSMDFWIVKNITGRLMVGLRWWSDITEEGESVWRFESIDDPSVVSKTDYRIFWYSMYLNTLIWALLGLINLFYIDRLLLIAVALTLSISNIIGYWKCSKEIKDAKQRLESGVQSFVSQTAMNYFSSSSFSLLSSDERTTSNSNTVTNA